VSKREAGIARFRGSGGEGKGIQRGGGRSGKPLVMGEVAGRKVLQKKILLNKWEVTRSLQKKQGHGGRYKINGAQKIPR